MAVQLYCSRCNWSFIRLFGRKENTINSTSVQGQTPCSGQAYGYGNPYEKTSSTRHVYTESVPEVYDTISESSGHYTDLQSAQPKHRETDGAPELPPPRPNAYLELEPEDQDSAAPKQSTAPELPPPRPHEYLELVDVWRRDAGDQAAFTLTRVRVRVAVYMGYSKHEFVCTFQQQPSFTIIPVELPWNSSSFVYSSSFLSWKQAKTYVRKFWRQHHGARNVTLTYCNTCLQYSATFPNLPTQTNPYFVLWTRTRGSVNAASHLRTPSRPCAC